LNALIAATTMAHKATANKKHYEKIDGLKVEVWQTV
jgi:predicted nucleic acid-binding protein